MTGSALTGPSLGKSETISEEEFILFREWIHRVSGILFSEEKRELLAARLSRRMRKLGLLSYRTYYRRVENDAEEQVLMLDQVCTNETQFFREPRQFDFVRDRLLPEWSQGAPFRGRYFRAWSAGCSTGEEPYSLAMTLLERLPPARVEIQATDLSRQALKRAHMGIWPLEKSSQIPTRLLKKFMLKGRAARLNQMKVGPEIAAVVRFQRLNLNDTSYPLTERFDLILCRNVLIYFSPTARDRVLQRLLRHLSPRGYLFLGHSESLSQMPELRVVMPTVYAPAGSASREATRTPSR